MPKSKGRRKTRERARERVATSQAAVEERKLTPAQYIRRRIFGWSIVALGITFGVTHWLAHLGALYEDRPVWDLTIGYPMAALLAIGGAIVLSK